MPLSGELPFELWYIFSTTFYLPYLWSNRSIVQEDRIDKIRRDLIMCFNYLVTSITWRTSSLFEMYFQVIIYLLENDYIISETYLCSVSLPLFFLFFSVVLSLIYFRSSTLLFHKRSIRNSILVFSLAV